jgi:uncharacterized protein (DUF433 family)/DNA-binding transcriptional MerR regulator
MESLAAEPILGRGVYGASEALRLLNFVRKPTADSRSVSRQTIARWMRGYDHGPEGDHHSPPLWQPDYANNDEVIEFSFRDLIELRFVKTFRDLGLSLPTIRECFKRAVEEIQDERPFSTQRFRTDGKSIFLDITSNLPEGEMVDLRRRQRVFKRIVEPSLKDLEFDASVVARWFPLGITRRSVVLDPARAFGRPIIKSSGVPTQVITEAVKLEGSADKVARLYDIFPAEVRDAQEFEERLAV